MRVECCVCLWIMESQALLASALRCHSSGGVGALVSGTLGNPGSFLPPFKNVRHLCGPTWLQCPWASHPRAKRKNGWTDLSFPLIKAALTSLGDTGLHFIGQDSKGGL